MSPAHRPPQLSLDLQDALNMYVQSGEAKNLSILRYKRLSQAIQGRTYAQIAMEEGTSSQAVAHSVKRDIGLLFKFAKLDNKGIVKDKK